MQINSQVLGRDMEILGGANIVETVNGNETNNYAVADESGRFTINVSSPQAQLKISYVGYYYDTFTAGEINQRYVQLDPSIESLDPVNTSGHSSAKSDDTVLYVLLAIAATAAVAAIVTRKPKPLTVKA